MLPVITIQREYAAGGRSVARLLSEKLGIPWYDKDFIKETSKSCALSEDDISKSSEEMNSATKIFDTFLESSNTDKVFYAQRECIIKLAKEPCIIVGRAAGAILDNVGIQSLHVYLYANEEDRIHHAKELNEYGKNDVLKYIQKRDKARCNFYKTYTGKELDDKHNYDICLNTSVGFDVCAEVIATIAKNFNK